MAELGELSGVAGRARRKNGCTLAPSRSYVTAARSHATLDSGGVAGDMCERSGVRARSGSRRRAQQGLRVAHDGRHDVGPALLSSPFARVAGGSSRAVAPRKRSGRAGGGRLPACPQNPGLSASCSQVKLRMQKKCCLNKDLLKCLVLSKKTFLFFGKHI